MKNVFIKFFILILTVGLVGCSTNTQKENTGIGAVTGAVVGGLAGSAIGQGTGKIVAIGAGAIIGALAGGAIGHSMDSTDNVKTTQALNSNKPTTWTNTKTGNTYTVTPVGGRMTINGNPNCHKFRTTAIVNGKNQRIYGYACRQADGTWLSVNP